MDLFIYHRKTAKGKKRMKRVGFLYEKICSEENIKLAILDAAKGKKKKRRDVRKVLNNLDFYIKDIQLMLKNKTFSNSKPRISYRYEKMQNKVREISVLPFYPDHIVHHAVMRIISPLLIKGMYHYCCANVPGRGEQRIRKSLSQVLKSDYRNTKYCLKIDIKQFYPSICIQELKYKLREIIKDSDALWILDTIVDLQDKGLPLGSYCSQWLANYYLQSLDHFIKEKIRVAYLYRYADDLVLLDGNRRKILMAEKLIDTFLMFENLEVKNTWRIFKVNESNAIDFVGYKFYRDKIAIRKKIFKNIRRVVIRLFRKIKLLKKITSKQIRSLMSYLGYIKNSNSFIIKNRYLAFLPLKQLKTQL